MRKCCVAVAHLRPDDEPDALRCFEREPRAATRDHIEEEPGVLPELPLVAADEEISVFDRAEEHVARPDERVAATEAHGRASVAAAAALMEEERTVNAREVSDELARSRGVASTLSGRCRFLP